ncbi:hypothetical protein Bind_0569 [Beijerinckia indica subsp. indica ATCC 9039]|uniref:Uncharacterized protein n=1 Tax=Beijerinckia indica subsp. indica (strain ATCC 9039 / DSM 1715 / NCIMB 8712) TaxID=395963 RepID=B2IFL0_BEII9|nr:hypothetical protein Bind_0569 [Beijerinckia indica subsp. indica ATCC 9039]
MLRRTGFPFSGTIHGSVRTFIATPPLSTRIDQSLDLNPQAIGQDQIGKCRIMDLASFDEKRDARKIVRCEGEPAACT